MAISYEWDVSTVDTYPTKDSKSDVVWNVHWRLKATDDTNKETIDGVEVNITSDVYGSQVLDTSDLSSFTEFADLTASDVQGWVEAALGADEVQSKKDGLDAIIAEKVTPTSVQKLIA
tara:strand:+ start:716 stop:1069 length:354 start_codon:yes stop_codon:yes gene_type:complete